MKEVLTKSFWQGVKSTFYEALEGSAPANDASPIPVKDNPNASSTSETPSATSPSGEQH